MSNVNNKIVQFRSDAGDVFKPAALTILDPQKKAFKEIISHQIVYGDDNITILFVAAVDSQNRFGIFKVDLKNAIKSSSSLFVNLLPPKLRSYTNYSKEFNFSLFALNKGNLLYPSNDSGQWHLLSLTTGSVLKEWNHKVLLFNPSLKDDLATWTTKSGETSQLYIHNFKTDAQDILNLKDSVQILSTNKDQLVFVNSFAVDSSKKIMRIQSYQNGATKILYELDATSALFSNFVFIGSNLIFTSEKTNVSGAQIQVLDAYLNVYDVTKKQITQRIKYPAFLVEIMRKQSVQNLRLLHSPMFNQTEILFSLNEMGGLIKYEFKTANWFYIQYPMQDNSCFNPSWINVQSR